MFRIRSPPATPTYRNQYRIVFRIKPHYTALLRTTDLCPNPSATEF